MRFFFRQSDSVVAKQQRWWLVLSPRHHLQLDETRVVVIQSTPGLDCVNSVL
jgi:hypothetical protein